MDQLEGNYGFRDQQLALGLVRSNIGRFGGDPDAITLFGESAGAMSVGAHLVAPGSADLFRAAIMQSNPYGIRFKSPAEASAVRRAFDVATGQCLSGTLDCLRRLSAPEVVEIEDSAIVTVVPALSHSLSRLLAWDHPRDARHGVELRIAVGPDPRTIRWGALALGPPSPPRSSRPGGPGALLDSTRGWEARLRPSAVP